MMISKMGTLPDGKVRDAVDRSITAIAADIADRAHAHQHDKAGRPYLDHVRRVATYVDPADEMAVAVALLHDTVEDTALTLADLTSAGMPTEVVDAVALLTRREDQPEAVYYARIRRDPLALEGKLADLADNTDPQRLALLTEDRQAKLRRKYAAAYQALGTDCGDGERRRNRSRVPR